MDVRESERASVKQGLESGLPVRRVSPPEARSLSKGLAPGHLVQQVKKQYLFPYAPLVRKMSPAPATVEVPASTQLPVSYRSRTN